MRLLKPITIRLREGVLTLQEGDTHEVKNKMAHKIFHAMLMHSDSMTFYSASSYEDMCTLLRAIIHSDLNK